MGLLLLAGCSLAPDYHTPEVALGKTYKEAGDWLPVKTDKAAMDKGAWWEAFGDPVLNGLENKVTTANQDLKVAVAQYDEASAAAAYARADFFPTVTADAQTGRQRTSRTSSGFRTLGPSNTFLAGGQLSYELDLWGRVRNGAKAGEKRAEAAAADVAAVDVSLHAELAMDYFALRGQDAAEKVVDEAVGSYQKAFELTKSRFAGGVAPQADVDQAETQLENARMLAADTRLKRAQLEHAIATLVGESASNFVLEMGKMAAKLPAVAPGLPSILLEQRPDVAAAAARVEAANADIGVARAAYFPNLSLSAAGGFNSASTSGLFNAPSLFWSIGPSALLTVFDGGRISALSDEARARYDAAVANYRQTALSAFQEVEDHLASLRQLEQENTTQTRATAAAERALTHARDRYRGGIATYLDVVITQNTALDAELNSIDVRVRQLTAGVLLVKALGGGWQADAIAEPNPSLKSDSGSPAPEAIQP